MDLSKTRTERIRLLRAAYEEANGGTQKRIVWSDIADQLEVDREQADQISAYWQNEGLLKARDLGGGKLLTHAGVKYIEDMTASEKGGRSEAYEKSEAVARSDDPRQEHRGPASISLFISHSSVDAELARRLIALVQIALNLESDGIRCTNIDGFKLPMGIPTGERLRREIHDCAVFLAVLTPSSLKSTYVLFELGARWGAEKALLPLLGSGLHASQLEGPLKEVNCLSCDSEAQLHQFLNDLAELLGRRLDRASAYQRYMEEVAAESRNTEAESKSTKDDFVMYGGVKFRRKPSGGFEDTAYCPKCEVGMGMLDGSMPFTCGRCDALSGFNAGKLQDKLREVQKEYP